MLNEYIKSIGIDPHSHDGSKLIEESVLYLSGVTGAFEFQHAVKVIDLSRTGMSGKDFRLRLAEHSYFTVNIKYATLFYSMIPHNNAALSKLQAYLSEADVHLLRDMFARRKIRTMVKANARHRGLSLHDVTLQAMRKDTRDFEKYIPKVMKHIKSKVYSKLRFVVKSENSTLIDFQNDVTCKTLRAYYSLIPTKDPEALVLNYLRSAASKHVINLIKFHTTDKRGRMVNLGTDGYGGTNYGLVCESENQHVANADGPEYSYEGVSNNISTDEARKVEASIVYERLIRRSTGRKRAAIEILAGNYDERFSEYLRKAGSLKPEDDHTDYQRRVSHTTFLHALAKYLGVIREAFMSFVASVGQTLVAHKEYA